MPAILIKGKYFTLNEIIDHLRRNKFIYNTEFQRSGLIWPKYKQEKLIDSIIKNLSIGLLFLKKRGKKYEVLDGQQRLKTIYKFVKGTLNTSAEFTPEFPNKSYKDLKKDKRRFPDFRAFKVYYTLVVSGAEQEVSDIFLRLQEGMPLNMPEKLNAILGEMRNFIVDVSKHSIFKCTSISNHRFSHRHLAAQIALLELSTNFETQLFPDLRLKDLSQMYEKYELEIPRGLHKRIHGALNLLNKILSKDAKVIRKKSDLPLIYILTSYLRKKYIINKSEFRNSSYRFSQNLNKLILKKNTKKKMNI